MALWLLERVEDESADYDETQAIVVRANSEAQARKVASEPYDEVRIPTEHIIYFTPYGDEGKAPWLDTSRTTCTRLDARGPAKFIIRDFRAG